jgi:hypothetical protein
MEGLIIPCFLDRRFLADRVRLGVFHLSTQED